MAASNGSIDVSLTLTLHHIHTEMLLLFYQLPKKRRRENIVMLQKYVVPPSHPSGFCRWSFRPGSRMLCQTPWIRSRLSFAILRVTNLCLRGSRTKWRSGAAMDDGVDLPELVH